MMLLPVERVKLPGYWGPNQFGASVTTVQSHQTLVLQSAAQMRAGRIDRNYSYVNEVTNCAIAGSIAAVPGCVCWLVYWYA